MGNKPGRPSYTPLAAGASTAALGYLLSRYGAGITDIPTNLMAAGVGGGLGYLGGKAYDEGEAEQTAARNEVKANIEAAKQNPMTPTRMGVDLASAGAGALAVDKGGHMIGQKLTNMPLGSKAPAVNEAIAKARSGVTEKGLYDTTAQEAAPEPTWKSISEAGSKAAKGLHPSDAIHSGLVDAAVAAKSGTKGFNTVLRTGRLGAGSVAGALIAEWLRRQSAQAAVAQGEADLAGAK